MHRKGLHPPHTSAYVSIRQHTSAYVSIRQHTSAYVSLRQLTSAYVSIRQHTQAYLKKEERVAPSASRLYVQRKEREVREGGDSSQVRHPVESTLAHE
jgi:hypothetical protein